ncbi:MAG: translocation/assembly module TamB domain-containing protein [Polyangia bacterium]
MDTDNEHPKFPAQYELRRKRGFLRKVVVGSVLVFLTAYTGVFFKLNDRVLGRLISGLVTNSVRGTFTLGRAHYDYFGGLWSIVSNRTTHVRGGDFEMVDPDGNAVMRVPHVEADVHLRELVVSLLEFGLSGHFHVHLHFERADIASGWAVIAPTRSSFGTNSPEMNIVATMTGKKVPAVIDDRSELFIEVGEVNLDGVDFALASSNVLGQASWVGWAEAAHAHGRLSYSSSRPKASPDGPAFFFLLDDISVARGQLQLGSFLFPLAGLHGDWFGTKLEESFEAESPIGFGKREELDFSAQATTLDGNVKVTGKLMDAYGTHTGVRLRIELEHGAGLATLLPQPIGSWIGGDPKGAVTVDGPFGNVAIGGELEGAVVDIAGLKVQRAGGTFALLGSDLLRLDKLHGDLARGKVRGRVDVHLSDRGTWRADIDATGIDPAVIALVPPSMRSLLAGRLQGKVKLDGGFGTGSTSTINVNVGSLALDRSAKDPLPRHFELAGDVDWTGTRFGLRHLAVRADGLSLDTSGSLSVGGTPSATFDFSLTAGKGPWASRIGLPGTVALDRGLVIGHVSGPLDGLEGQARVDLGGLVIKGRHVTSASADVELRGGTLSVGSLIGEGVGAQLEGQGKIHLFETDAHGRTRLDRAAPAEIDADLRAQGADLTEVAGTVAIAGKADLDVHLEGPLAHPDGHARVEVPSLLLLGDRYQHGKLAFDFSQAGAKVTALHLERVDGGQLDGRGNVSWAGALDLDLSPRAFPLAALPGVSSLPIAILGTLSGKVHLGGDLSRPEPGGLFELVGAKIRDTFFGDGSLKLEPGADAIHITGRFFQNYSVDGYLTLFPKLSIAVTVHFDDIELEKVFPEIRQLAEVRGRATGDARLTADAEHGLTFAEVRMSALSLVLSGLDESGHARRLVVRNQGDVAVSTTGHELNVESCQLRSALGAFAIKGRISPHDTDVSLRGQIGLELLEYFFTSFFQHMHGDAMVDLTVKGDLSARPQLIGSLDLRRATLQPKGLEGHRLHVPSGSVVFAADGVTLRSLKMELDGAVAQASGHIALDGYKPGALAANVSGELSPQLLEWVLPDQIDDASGRVGVKVALSGTWQRPEWRGDAEIKNTRISLRRTGREIEVTEGTLRFVNYDIAIGCGDAGDRAGCRSITGVVDDEARFSIDGKVGFGESLSLRSLNIHADASDLSYNGGDFAVRVSPSFELSGDASHLNLSGTINIVEGRYTAPFDVTELLFKFARVSERPQPFWEGIPLLEHMKLDLRARTTGPFLIRNNIADLTFSADLQVGGTTTSPTLGGSATVDQGGTINVPICRFPFQTERSQLTFDPSKRYPETPYLNISATGVLVSDRTDASQNVTLQILGPLNAVQTIASTQQGVQGNDVVVMCLTGRTADEIRRGVSPASTGGVGRAPGLGAVQGTTTTEGVAKGASGALVSSAIDPIRHIAHLDTLSLEFGATGVDIQACKRWTRGLKTCGLGEFGFVGGTRVGGYGQYRISDQLSVLGRGEYLTRGVETVQDSLTRGRLELNFKVPLVW